MTQSIPRLFDDDFLRQAEHLHIACRRASAGTLHGRRAGNRAGTGQEFVDRRDYAAGDDFRHIDWGVFARHGNLLVRRFVEEADLPVYLFVDCSASMACGDPVKFDLGRRVAAGISYIALSDLDRVSIVGFGPGASRLFQLTRGKVQMPRLLAFLSSLEASMGTADVDVSVRRFLQTAPDQGVVIFISDLYFADGFEGPLDALRGARFEPHVVHLYDAREAEPELRGQCELVDAETGAVSTVEIDGKARQVYRERFDDFLQSVRDYAQRAGIGLVQSTTRRAYDTVILELLRGSGTQK